MKKALEGQDSSAIKRASDELNTHMQKIGESMQGQGGSAPGPQAGAAGPQKPDIEEAEVEILDDEDKK